MEDRSVWLFQKYYPSGYLDTEKSHEKTQISWSLNSELDSNCNQIQDDYFNTNPFRYLIWWSRLIIHVFTYF
jgi:hypothetical protein